RDLAKFWNRVMVYMVELKPETFDLALRAVTLMSHHFTNKKSKMAVALPKRSLYYQGLHEIHVAVGTIYSFNLTITKSTSSGDRFKIVVALKDFIRSIASIASIPPTLLKSLKTFLLGESSFEIYFFAFLLKNLLADSPTRFF
ncbi:14532_t:CDS:2, partial [Gigaspora rosea]